MEVTLDLRKEPRYWDALPLLGILGFLSQHLLLECGCNEVIADVCSVTQHPFYALCIFTIRKK